MGSKKTFGKMSGMVGTRSMTSQVLLTGSSYDVNQEISALGKGKAICNGWIVGKGKGKAKGRLKTFRANSEQ